MGILSGLGGMGLGNLEGFSLYENAEKPQEKENSSEEKVKIVPKAKEEDYLFEKSFSCPVCMNEFKALAVRAGKTKLLGTELDLRPKYENVEPLKYDVIVCDKCGCASLSRFWGPMTPSQRKAFVEQIGKSYKKKIYITGAYTYEHALERYQLALANAMVKGVKASEKAYICLKAGWLLRSQIETLDEESDSEKISNLINMEEEYLANALEGFVVARSKELMPICGMDEATLDYLLATLMYRLKKYEQAAKMVGNLLVSRTANSRIKDRALNLKELIKEKL